MKHLAIIADGNRRWAVANNLPKNIGHVRGLDAIERCCEWAINRDIPYLTVFCFSTENWGREESEVDHIMKLARHYYTVRQNWYVKRGIRVVFRGRRDRLPPEVVTTINNIERATILGKNLVLTICCDYGGRDEIVRAIEAGARTEAEITASLNSEVPDPDMILRTGGRMRLSNFLLWQSAYAELYFSNTLFPALESSELDEVLASYRDRKRTFGV